MFDEKKHIYSIDKFVFMSTIKMTAEKQYTI